MYDQFNTYRQEHRQIDKEECRIDSSKEAPKGTFVSKNKNVDAVYYHNLFAKEGGVFDAIDEKMPWLRGAEYIIQQDGAKPHTANGTIEELKLAGNDGRGMIPRFKTVFAVA